MGEQELENEKNLFLWKQEQKRKNVTQWILAAYISIFAMFVIFTVLYLISQIINN